MNGVGAGVCGPTGFAVAGPEYVWDEYNQLYRISDGRLVKQNDPYYDYCMFLMQQNLECNPTIGRGCLPIHEVTMPCIPGHPMNVVRQVLERGMAKGSDTYSDQGQISDMGNANNNEMSVTSGTVRNANNYTQPTGTAQSSGSCKESENGRQQEAPRMIEAVVNYGKTNEKSGKTREAETASSKWEMDEMLVDGKKLVKVQEALDFLKSSPRLTLSKVSNADSGNGAMITSSLSELNKVLQTSSRRSELDKVIPKFPLHGINTATVKSLTKRLSKISRRDAKNARPDLFILSTSTSGGGLARGEENAGVRVGEGEGNDNDQEQGYFLFRLHSSGDEASPDDTTPTTVATTTTESTHTTTTTYDSATSSSSTSSSPSSSSSSSSSDDDSSEDRKKRSKSKRRRKKYLTTDDTSEYDGEYDDYSDTEYYDDYDYTDYDYDDDYDYEDYSESSSPQKLPRPRRGHKVPSSSSETSVWSPAVLKRASRPRQKQPTKVQQMAGGAKALVQRTTQTVLQVIPQHNGSNQNTNNLTNPAGDGVVSGRQDCPAAEYAGGQEQTTVDRKTNEALINCVEEAIEATQQREEWHFREDVSGSCAPEPREAQVHYDRRLADSETSDHQDDRGMTHDPVYDHEDERRMNDGSVNETQVDRNSTYFPQGDRRLSQNQNHCPRNDRQVTQNSTCYPQDDRRIYDPHYWQRSDVFVGGTTDPRDSELNQRSYMQRNQNANEGTDGRFEEEASAMEKKENAAASKSEEQEATRLAEEEDVMRMAAAAQSESGVNASRSFDRYNGRRSTEFVEIMAKAIAFPDGKFEIVDVDVVPLRSRRPGPLKVKSSTSRIGQTKRVTRRAPSCKRFPPTPSNADVAVTPQTNTDSQLPLAPSQNHPQLHQTPFSVIQQNKVTCKVNDVILPNTRNYTTANNVNDASHQTAISDVMDNRVSDELRKTTRNDVIVFKASDVPQRTTSATQTDVMTETDSRLEFQNFPETAKSSEFGSEVTMKRDSSTQTVTRTDECFHQQQVTGPASVPPRSPLRHRHPLNLSSNCTSRPSPIPPPPPHAAAPLPSVAMGPQLTHRPRTCDQILQTDRLESDASSTHLVKYGNFVYSLYQHDQLTDVILKAGVECFYAHRSVLACHSLYFSSVFTHDPVSSYSSADPFLSRPTPDILEINDISSSILRKILEYIYTGQIALHQSFLLDVLMAANKLGLPTLESYCIQTLNALHPHELLDVMISADKQGLAASDLTDKLWHRIACHFKTVARTKQFLQMSVNCVHRLLSDDDLVLTSEIDVAQAAIRWINEDRDTRIPLAGRVLSCIRFKNLTPDELVSFGRLEGYILNDPVVKDAILEANWYHTCQFGRTDTGMTSFKSPHIRQKTDLQAHGYTAELPTHPFNIPYENWRN